MRIVAIGLMIGMVFAATEELPGTPVQDATHIGAANSVGTEAPGVVPGQSNASSETSRRGNFVGEEMGSETGVFYRVEKFYGSDFSIRVNACLAVVERVGGGTCDARSLGGSQAASESIVVGDGSHRTALVLPSGSITFASGKQLMFRSYATIRGQGSGPSSAAGSGTTINCVNQRAGTGCVQSYNEGSTATRNSELSNFQILATGVSDPGSAALNLGGVGYSDVQSSRFELITAGGFDVGVLMGGDGGCTCYNYFDQLFVSGKTSGVSTINNSSYPGDVNSNTWMGGAAWGATGISDLGGGKNRWISPDIEGASKHGFVLGGYGASMISPYEEANGCDLLAGPDSFVTGPMSYGGGFWTPCRDSTSTNSFWWGPDAAPQSIGVGFGFSNKPATILFGAQGMNDRVHAKLAFSLEAQNATAPLDLIFVPNGQLENSYGISGHAPLRLGAIINTAGITGSGKSTFSALANPPAPTVSSEGSTGTTTYEYSVVCHDWSGGISLTSSPGKTGAGSATLSTKDHNVIKWRCGDGYARADVLKWVNGGWQALAMNRGGTSAADYPLKDTGQTTSPYALPTRNTTADMSIAGRLTVGGHSPAITVASGSLALATDAIDPASCQHVTAGLVNSAVADGVSAEDVIDFTPDRSIKAVAGFSPGKKERLSITAYPTGGFVNFDVCNESDATITPGAVRLNWQVKR